MSTDTSTRQRMPQKARTTEQARRAVSARWTPDARTAAAIRTLVEQAPPLTAEQVEQLRAVLARPVAEPTDRAVSP